MEEAIKEELNLFLDPSSFWSKKKVMFVNGVCLVVEGGELLLYC
jgi:hypothetical protein